MSNHDQTPTSPPERGVVEIVPLGRVDQVALAVVAANIQSLLGLNSDVTEARPEPRYAFLAARRQYDAGPILKELAEGVPPGRIRLGLTNGDLCLPILTHVFGEAQMGGRAAVISLHRLGPGPLAGRAGPGVVYERLAKVALHETAHVLGVAHCRADGCLMRFSQKLEHLDQLKLTFCPACEADIVRLRRRYLEPG